MLQRKKRSRTAFDLSGRIFSPCQFNPFTLNPLRVLLAEEVDFARLPACASRNQAYPRAFSQASKSRLASSPAVGKRPISERLCAAPSSSANSS